MLILLKYTGRGFDKLLFKYSWSIFLELIEIIGFLFKNGLYLKFGKLEFCFLFAIDYLLFEVLFED